MFSLFKKNKNISNRSTLLSVEKYFPEFFAYLESRLNRKITKLEKLKALGEFCVQHKLQTAEVLFSEWKLSTHIQNVQMVSPQEAADLQAAGQLLFFDVREEWETHHAKIEGAVWLSEEELLQKVESENRDQKVLLYCHFGVRSLDIAALFQRKGFKKIYVIKGGIDAWSLQIDSKIERYSEGWC